MVSQRCAVRWPLAPHRSEWHDPQLLTTLSRPGPGGKTLAGVNFSAEAAADPVCADSRRDGSDVPQPASNEKLTINTRRISARNILVPPMCSTTFFDRTNSFFLKRRAHFLVSTNSESIISLPASSVFIQEALSPASFPRKREPRALFIGGVPYRYQYWIPASAGMTGCHFRREIADRRSPANAPIQYRAPLSSVSSQREVHRKQGHGVRFGP
jgi:hypothetical protein